MLQLELEPGRYGFETGPEIYDTLPYFLYGFERDSAVVGAELSLRSRFSGAFQGLCKVVMANVRISWPCRGLLVMSLAPWNVSASPRRREVRARAFKVGRRPRRSIAALLTPSI